jgi:hypothetical protein
MKADEYKENRITSLFEMLAKVRKNPLCNEAFSKGGYRQIVLTNRQYVFARETDGQHVFIAVNNDENEAVVRFNATSDTMLKILSASGANVSGDNKGDINGGLINNIETEQVKITSMGNYYYEIKLPACSGAVFVTE